MKLIIIEHPTFLISVGLFSVFTNFQQVSLDANVISNDSNFYFVGYKCEQSGQTWPSYLTQDTPALFIKS